VFPLNQIGNQFFNRLNVRSKDLWDESKKAGVKIAQKTFILIELIEH